MEPGEFDRQIAALAALEEGVRRSLYRFVASQQGEVSRDEAARAVGVSRSLAGFHLDRLAEGGLLVTSFRRLSGRRGPGAGRPSKLYRRSERQLAVSLPPRSYELAARVLAAAVDASSSAVTQEELGKVARAVGEGIGEEARARVGPRAGRKRLLSGAVAALAAHGYEPEQTGEEIRLRNCPFHALVGKHRELVCGMNLDLITGVVSGLALPGVTSALDPQSGRCCVALKIHTRK